MSTDKTTQPATSSSLKQLMTRHPLIAFFILAFGGTWILLLPVVLGKNGTGFLPFTLPTIAIIVLFLLATFAGPTLSAFVMTALTSGKDGVRHLLRRYVQWRVGIQWYFIAIFGFLFLDVLSAGIASGGTILPAIIQQWPLIFTSYLPLLLTVNFIIPLGEEPGWRGFALPRLQEKYGPLLGTFILGTLHGLWHFPTFFIGGGIGVGTSFSFPTFGLFLVGAIALSMAFTWVFNNVQGSLLIMILLHGANERTDPFFQQALHVLPHGYDTWATIIFFGAIALIIILTKGRLSYKRERVAQAVEALPIEA